VVTTIKKWGNSLGLRIPKSFAAEADIEEGSEVDISVREGELVVTPRRKPHYELSDLLAKVSKKNVHGEIDTGKPVGREVW
jgi:antitoxin MazE